MSNDIVEIPSELTIRAINLNAFLLTEEEAAAALRVSRRTFQSLRDEEWMPKAILLGPRILRWSADELRKAIAGMPRLENKRQALPDSLRRYKEGGASK